MPTARSFRLPRNWHRLALGLLAAAGFAGASGGCAYFNTLYNAKAKFAEAQEIKYRADPDRLEISLQERNLYDDAIEKAARVVKFYENSKWVDDALLLMGRAAFEKGDYSTALRKFDEILTFYPESNLMAQTLLWQGRTRIAVNELAEGEAALTQAAAFGENKWRDSVVYFTGLAAYEREDFDVALASFTEIVNKHHKSEWFPEAGMTAGEIAEEQGELQMALSIYERVWKKSKYPEDKYRGGMARGRVFQEIDLRAAEKTFRSVAAEAANDRDRGEALLEVGRTIARRGDVDQAVGVYADILERYPRSEASAWAQYEVGHLYDVAGDLETAIEQYDLVKEQGTGFDAWQEASERTTQIQRVLDLRAEIAAEDPVEVERKRFLLAEQFLEKIGNEEAALAEYASLADDAEGTEWGSRALYAKAWILEHRRADVDSAESLLFRLANDDPRSEVGQSARRRFGYPVYEIEEIQESVEFIRPDGASAEPEDIVLNRVLPEDLPLPAGQSKVKVWVQVNVADDGSVAEATVKKSAGDPFDAAALAAARASQFLRPGDGGPAITVVQYEWPIAPAGADDEPSAAERDAALDAADSAVSGAGVDPGASSSILEGLGAAPDSATAALADSIQAVTDSIQAVADSARARANNPLQKLRDRQIDPSTAD